MTTFLLHGNSLHNPELRHEIGEAIMDAVTFAEHDGRRIVLGGVLEEDIFARREDVVDEFRNIEDLGADALVRDLAVPEDAVWPELIHRALGELGAQEVVVPPGFPVGVADYLRERGVSLVVNTDAWAMRRRRKTPWELEGMERAQRAAEVAMLTAARMLREAEPTGAGMLRFEGETLTAELIRAAMTSELTSQGTDCEEILVHSGDAALAGHEPGRGPIQPDQTCIIDCYPQDRRTGAYSDMTRTFVPGTPTEEVEKLHRHCREALDIAFEALKPGRDDAYVQVSEHLHSHGFPTQQHRPVGEPLREGFRYALGHGVGLEVHEKPWMGRRSDRLMEGDVVAVEPGLYFKGVGGVRLEDTVLVTANGVEHFTDPYPYELQP